MKIKENSRFQAAAKERVKDLFIEKNLTRNIWYFHKPASRYLLKEYFKVTLLKIGWFVVVLATPWLIAMASFEVANVISILTVFIAAPAFLALKLTAAHHPKIPDFLRGAIDGFITKIDFSNILSALFFLMAHNQGLWRHLFTPDNDRPITDWLLFLLDRVLTAGTFGIWNDVGIQLSTIEPVKSISAALVLYVFNLMIFAVVIETIIFTYRWYRGGQLFIGTNYEASRECIKRKDVSGSYVSRIGRLSEELETVPSIYHVAMLGDENARISITSLHSSEILQESSTLAEHSNKTAFGAEAVQTLGVTHIEVKEQAPLTRFASSKEVRVYHTKFIPTGEISATLNLKNLTLCILFNDSTTIKLNPLTVFKAIHRNDDIILTLIEKSKLQPVGIRSCELSLIPGSSSDL